MSMLRHRFSNEQWGWGGGGGRPEPTSSFIDVNEEKTSMLFLTLSDTEIGINIYQNLYQCLYHAI